MGNLALASSCTLIHTYIYLFNGVRLYEYAVECRRSPRPWQAVISNERVSSDVNVFSPATQELLRGCGHSIESGRVW